MVLAIAERFGQLPEAIENMDQYWFERIAVVIEAEGLKAVAARKKK